MEFKHESNRIFYVDEQERLLAEVTFPAEKTGTVNIKRTFVDDSLRGQGVAGKLMEEAYREIKGQGKKASLTCSYARKWFDQHQDKRDILK